MAFICSAWAMLFRNPFAAAAARPYFSTRLANGTAAAFMAASIRPMASLAASVASASFSAAVLPPPNAFCSAGMAIIATMESAGRSVDMASVTPPSLSAMAPAPAAPCVKPPAMSGSCTASAPR